MGESCCVNQAFGTFEMLKKVCKRAGESAGARRRTVLRAVCLDSTELDSMQRVRASETHSNHESNSMTTLTNTTTCPILNTTKRFDRASFPKHPATIQFVHTDALYMAATFLFIHMRFQFDDTSGTFAKARRRFDDRTFLLYDMMRSFIASAFQLHHSSLYKKDTITPTRDPV